MKIAIIILSIGILLISMVLGCQENNDFEIGDVMDVCTGNCTYQDPTTYNYVDCDANIHCYLTANYPNGTFIVNHAEMSRNGSIYNYTIGNTTVTGIYQAQVDCKGVKGWDDSVNFYYSVSSEEVTYIATGGGYSIPTSLTGHALEEIDDWKDKVEKNIRKYVLIGVFVLVFMFLMIQDIKKRRRYKLAKEVTKIQKKENFNKK